MCYEQEERKKLCSSGCTCSTCRTCSSMHGTKSWDGINGESILSSKLRSDSENADLSHEKGSSHPPNARTRAFEAAAAQSQSALRLQPSGWRAQTRSTRRAAPNSASALAQDAAYTDGQNDEASTKQRPQTEAYFIARQLLVCSIENRVQPKGCE